MAIPKHSAHRKLAHLESSIRVKLGLLIQKRAADPRFEWVTITAVHISKDYTTADILFSTYQGTVDTTLTDALNKASSFFRQKLSKTLASKHIPRLRFIYDKGFDHTVQIEHLLDHIAQNRNSI